MRPKYLVDRRHGRLVGLVHGRSGSHSGLSITDSGTGGGSPMSAESVGPSSILALNPTRPRPAQAADRQGRGGEALGRGVHVRCRADGVGCHARRRSARRPPPGREWRRLPPLVHTRWADCGRAATPFAVGSSIDLICRERDSTEVRMRRRLDEGDACFSTLSKQWTEGTRQAFGGLPRLDWEGH